MAPLPFGPTLTIGILAFCLILVAFLIRRIVTRIGKSTRSSWVRFLYLLISIWPLYGTIRAIVLENPWHLNPFFYFWLLLSVFCWLSFFLTHPPKEGDAQ